MTIAAFTQNLHTKKSWYEDEYLETIARYKDSELRFEFQHALAFLIQEMDDRVSSEHGNDVLGEFFEQHISNGRNGQFFTPYHICKCMTAINHSDVVNTVDESESRPLRILDPTCGSGRMLLAAHETFGRGHEYYGIDIDRTCVKMTAINMFLNGIWRSEVMCANALSPDDFVIAYRVSMLPLGIFKIEQKEQSLLWHLHKNSFQKVNAAPGGETIQLSSIPFHERSKDSATQLDLFGNTPTV
jgi:ribosomal protein L11 methylase PrmA